MPQSLSRVLLHVVFSTKNRAPVLTPELQEKLHPYLGGVLNSIGCSSIQVGGVEDHVHLFFMLSRIKTIAQVVEKVKTSSSKDHYPAVGLGWTLAPLQGAEGMGNSRNPGQRPGLR